VRAVAFALVCACGGAKPPPLVANASGAPRLVAAQSEDIIEEESNERLEIDELSPAGLRRIARVDRLLQAFGFRDPRTLVVLLAGPDDPTLEIYRDGKVTETITVPAKEFAADSLGMLAFTASNEVWLAGDCDTDTGACKRFLRVLPAPRLAADKPPPGIDPERSAGRWNRHRAPRQVLAPAGLEVGFTRGMNGEGTVTCTSPSGKTSNDKLKPTDVRWVRAQPPIYEVTFADDPTPGHSYFRACEDTEYREYRELSDGMWVLAGPMMDVGLMLTFFHDDKQIGQIERGGDFITNR
jgi:hypothetical protein